IAIIGIGNCASSLVQGIEYYKNKDSEDAIGLMHWEIGGYKPYDIEIVAAFDIDKRKVGKDVSEAIFELPNCTTIFCKDIPKTGVRVEMGAILDGFSEHMRDYEDKYRFVLSDEKEPSREDCINILKESGAQILLSYLPVGSENAARFYAECTLKAGVGFINNMPVFIVSNPEWGKRFEKEGIPIIGDDVKSQLGATIVHRGMVNKRPDSLRGLSDFLYPWFIHHQAIHCTVSVSKTIMILQVKCLKFKVPKAKGIKMTITCFGPVFIGLKMGFPILSNYAHLIPLIALQK
ncbi:unnamed protein product, partial [marine sediment metagenome]